MRVESGRTVTGSTGVDHSFDSGDADTLPCGVLKAAAPEHPLNTLKGERTAAYQVARELLVRVVGRDKRGTGDGVKDLAHSWQLVFSGCLLRVESKGAKNLGWHGLVSVEVSGVNLVFVALAGSEAAAPATKAKTDIAVVRRAFCAGSGVNVGVAELASVDRL